MACLGLATAAATGWHPAEVAAQPANVLVRPPEGFVALPEDTGPIGVEYLMDQGYGAEEAAAWLSEVARGREAGWTYDSGAIYLDQVVWEPAGSGSTATSIVERARQEWVAVGLSEAPLPGSDSLFLQAQLVDWDPYTYLVVSLFEAGSLTFEFAVYSTLEIAPSASLLLADALAFRQLRSVGGAVEDGPAAGADGVTDLAPGGFLPLYSGPADRAALTWAGYGQDAAGAMGGASRSAYMRQWLDPRSGSVAAVTSFEAGTGYRIGVLRGLLNKIFQAPGGSTALSPSREEREVLEGLEATVLRAMPVDGSDLVEVTLALSRGGYVFLIESTAGGAREAMSLALQTARAQAEHAASLGFEAKAPPGLASVPEAVGAACGALTALLVVYRGALWLLARRRLRHERIRAPDRIPGDVDLRAVTPEAIGLRRRGHRIAVVQLLSLYLTLVGLAIFPYSGFRPVWLAVAVTGLVLGPASTIWSRRSEQGHRRWSGRSPALILKQLLRVTLPGGCAVAALLIGTLLFTIYLAVGAILAVNPLFVDESASDLDDAAMGAFTGLAVLGSFLAVIGLLLLRLARRQARLQAPELQHRDPRPTILYLRSFADDDVRVRSVPSGRKLWLELVAPRVQDHFEEVVAWELGAYGPVIAVGQPGRSLRSLGPARESLAAGEWQEGVAARIAEAGTIVVVLGRGEGFLWEIGEILRQDLLSRALLVMPPGEASDLRERWGALAERLSADEESTALPNVDGAAVLTAVVDRAGKVFATTADRRDEAAYRAALSNSVPQLLAWAG